MSPVMVATEQLVDPASPRSAAARPASRYRVGGNSPKSAPDGSRALVLWAAGPAAGALPASRAFAVHELEDLSTRAILQALRELQPRVLVVDAQWCQGSSRADLEELRRTAPRTCWILAWHDVTWPSVALLLDVDARAAVNCSVQPSVWAKAVTAVLDGEVWLPRAAQRWLYVKALAARRRELQERAACELTEREAEVHGLLEVGYTNKEIARLLAISPNTVKKHVAAVFEKGGLRSRRQVLG